MIPALECRGGVTELTSHLLGRLITLHRGEKRSRSPRHLPGRGRLHRHRRDPIASGKLIPELAKRSP